MLVVFKARVVNVSASSVCMVTENNENVYCSNDQDSIKSSNLCVRYKERCLVLCVTDSECDVVRCMCPEEHVIFECGVLQSIDGGGGGSVKVTVKGADYELAFPKDATHHDTERCPSVLTTGECVFVQAVPVLVNEVVQWQVLRVRAMDWLSTASLHDRPSWLGVHKPGRFLGWQSSAVWGGRSAFVVQVHSRFAVLQSHEHGKLVFTNLQPANEKTPSIAELEVNDVVYYDVQSEYIRACKVYQASDTSTANGTVLKQDSFQNVLVQTPRGVVKVNTQRLGQHDNRKTDMLKVGELVTVRTVQLAKHRCLVLSVWKCANESTSIAQSMTSCHITPTATATTGKSVYTLNLRGAIAADPPLSSVFAPPGYSQRATPQAPKECNKETCLFEAIVNDEELCVQAMRKYPRLMHRLFTNTQPPRANH